MPILATEDGSAFILHCDNMATKKRCPATVCLTDEYGTVLKLYPFELRRQALNGGWQPLNPITFDDHTLICSACVRERLKKEKRNKRERAKRKTTKTL